MFEAAVEFALPQRFRVLRHLGSGGMGTVFEALDTKTGGRVALKTLHASNPDALFYLKNEFRSLQDVVHPNLVNLLELIEVSGRFFVAMELVDGIDFLSYLRPEFVTDPATGLSETRRVALPTACHVGVDEEAPVSVRRGSQLVEHAPLRAVLAQLAAGLCALHDSGKLHRDVKPANILVTPSGRVVLVDFGLATELAAPAVRGEGLAVGTRAFVAPEQAAGQRVGAAADWFSVGVVLYLTLTGELPFQGADLERRRLAGAYRPVHELAPNAPEDLRALCGALLELDPALRPSGQRVLEWLGAAQAGVRCVDNRSLFVGRSTELEVLRLAAADSRQRAVSTFVVGDSGVGKSTLAREAIGRVGSASALVLSGRCYERELVPYKALDGIVDALSHYLLELDPIRLERLLPARASILTRVFPVLARVPGFSALDATSKDDPLEQRAQAFLALRELFTALAEQGPVLLYIDDLQWADRDSHLLLSDLLREPASPKLCLIATARPPAEGAPDRIRALCEGLGDARRIELEPLGQGDARRLAESIFVGSEASELADAIALESAGHPLFVVALAQHASHTGQRSIGSIRLDDALFARVESIPETARRLLEFVAVLGTPLEVELGTQLARIEPEVFAASANALRVARLTRSTADDAHARIEPYHDRVRETVLARLDGDARRACHQRIADVLESSGRAERDPQALVRHLEGAGLAKGAARQAELAAQHAESVYAFDQAAELYRTTLRLGTFDEDELRALNLRLAEALTKAGRAAEAARAYLSCASGATPENQLLYRRLAADHLLRSGHLEEGLQVLSDVLSELGDRLPSQRAALLTRQWHRLRSHFRGLGWSERSASQVSPKILQRIEAYHAVGVSLSLIDPIRGGAFEARALGLALDAGEPKRLAEVLVMESGYRGAIGASGLRAAERLLVEVAGIASRSGDPYIVAILDMMKGHLGIHAGEFARAGALLGRVLLQLRALPGTYFEQAFCHCFRLICLRNRGQLGELQAGFSDWVRDAQRRGDRFTEASLRFNLNNIWLAKDEPDEALRDLERATWINPEGGYHVQHWYEQHARAEVALYAGNGPAGLFRFREVRAQLSRSFILRLRLHRNVARWLLGRLILASLSAAPSRNGALREVTRIAAALWKEDEPLARCWSLLLGAAVATQREQSEHARVTLERAIQAAELADLPHCGASARLRLARLTGGESSLAQAWFEQQRIAKPERMLEVWAPGF